MILTVLAVIALGVGVIHSAADISDEDRMALNEPKSAIVQVVPPQEDLDYPHLGL